MENHIPSALIIKGSSLRLLFDDEVQYNRTREAVVIEGTRAGFLSLSNGLNFYSNSLEDIIEVSSFPFIKSKIKLFIEIDESLDGIDSGNLIRKATDTFIWKMSEREICVVASSIHSLGYLNSEIHFDDEKNLDEISIYCVVG